MCNTVIHYCYWKSNHITVMCCWVTCYCPTLIMSCCLCKSGGKNMQMEHLHWNMYIWIGSDVNSLVQRRLHSAPNQLDVLINLCLNTHTYTQRSVSSRIYWSTRVNNRVQNNILFTESVKCLQSSMSEHKQQHCLIKCTVNKIQCKINIRKYTETPVYWEHLQCVKFIPFSHCCVKGFRSVFSSVLW